MIAEKLSEGDAIGIICPSHVAGDDYKLIVKGIEQLGFFVNMSFKSAQMIIEER